MPELPEAERIRRVIQKSLRGLIIQGVQVRRADVIKGTTRSRSRRDSLLVGGRFKGMHRHGKRLALEVVDGRVLEIGLGMSGQMLLDRDGRSTRDVSHKHVIWKLAHRNGSSAGTLIWRDPRRFGGLTPMRSLEDLRQGYWGELGPDALAISTPEFLTRLGRTRRAIKPTLMDQRVLAGLGNIYADEALHLARIDPRIRSARLSKVRATTLLECAQELLAQATEAGGSTIRDFHDPTEAKGCFQASHAVYGRTGEPCVSCGEEIVSMTLGGRSTHWCTQCQKR